MTNLETVIYRETIITEIRKELKNYCSSLDSGYLSDSMGIKIMKIILKVCERNKVDARPICRILNFKLDKYWKIKDKVMLKNGAYTFDVWWFLFFQKNPGRKLDKGACRKYWSKRNCSGKKRKLIKNIEKTKLQAYDYLKLNL